MKRQLNRLRRVVGPQRDVASQLFGGAAVLPGSDAEAERYFRDIFDHLIRVADLIDSYKDLLTGAMDVYLSTVSNRLNLVVEQPDRPLDDPAPADRADGLLRAELRLARTPRRQPGRRSFSSGSCSRSAGAALLVYYLRRQRLL